MNTDDFTSFTEQFFEEKLEPIYLKIQQINQKISYLEKSTQKVIVTGGLLSK